MRSLPTGTVTFLFTDIEGSTALLQRLGDRRYAEVLEEHRRVLREAFGEGHGQLVNTLGDSFLVAFSRARDALAAAVAAQLTLAKHVWPDGASLRVRMGLHTGEPVGGTGDYVGLDVHRASRICSAGHGGQILVSRTVADLTTPDLPPGVNLKDLGAHRLKDLREREHLLQVMHPDLPADFPALKSVDARPNNLPVQLTSFVGREREIAEIKRHLSMTRLVTLTGTGGCGKTRLALQVAADLAEQYEDGVWLVETEAISDPFLVPTAVASALGLREEPGRLLVSTLTDSLRSKKLLLVLDNCEHLIEACAHLVQSLLRACPYLQFLATSREPLNINGEVTWRVPSLSLRPLGSPSDDNLISSEAGRLFVQRAQTALPTFAVTPANALLVADICYRLDGIPLAIELVATRVRGLTLGEIADQLNGQLALVTHGTRTALPRHRTLRATLDWSHNLLSSKERVALRRVAVFAGEFALQAVGVVCAGGGLEEAEILDLLTQLIDKSLVTMDEQGAGRYRLLETVRRYGTEKLLESGEIDELCLRHQRFFLRLVEGVESHLSGSEQTVWMDRLEKEHANLLAAMEWSRTRAPYVGLRIAGAMWEFWEARGYLSEGRRWLDILLEAAGPDAPPAVRAKASKGAAVIARDQGDTRRATALLDEALALYRGLGDSYGIASSLNNLGLVHWHEGNHALAHARLEEALVWWRRVGYQRGVAGTLANMGNLASEEGDYVAARSLYEKSLSVMRELGDQRSAATVVNNLGLACLYAGEQTLARSLLEQSLSIRRALGDKLGIAQSLINLGFAFLSAADYSPARSALQESLTLSQDLKYQKGVAESLINLGAVHCCEGDYASAHRLLEQSLRMMRGLRETRGIVACLEESANLAAAEGQTGWAAQILGATDRHRQEMGARAPFSDQVRYDHAIATARNTLGEDAFSAAYARGQAATLEQIVDEMIARTAPSGQSTA